MKPALARTNILRSALTSWRDTAAREGLLAASRKLVAALSDFLRDSTPSRRRQRYGDIDFDWEHRVDTTSAAVGWRLRLLGAFHSPYQPTDPALFREMMDALLRAAGKQEQDLRNFIFIDIGSGKGRVLLMASDYPFRRIVGVELLPALHEIAQENISKYHSEAQRCLTLECICIDATEFELPPDPAVLYMFNPLPESALRGFLNDLERSLRNCPREVYVLYHNPLLERVVQECATLRKVTGTHQYSIFGAKENEAGAIADIRS